MKFHLSKSNSLDLSINYFHRFRMIMRVLLLIWGNLNMTDCAFAIPHEPTVVKELHGVIEAAVWRSGFKFTRVDLDELHSVSRRTEKEIVVEPHWIVILSDVKGIDAEAVQAFSALILRNEPWDSVYDYKKTKDGRLLFWIPGTKDMKLKHGDRIVLSEAVLDYWDEGAAIEYKMISVDDGNTKAVHKFPKLKDTKSPPAIKRKKP